MRILFFMLLLAGLRTDAQDSLLWYRQPAKKWTEALPVGNGRLGAMIYGDATDEHVQFNEATLWTGRPRSYQRPDAWRYLDSIRLLLREGRQAEAEAMGEQHFMGRKDRDDDAYGRLKAAWVDKVRRDTAFAAVDLDDGNWKTLEIPTPDGWEAAGLQGLDGAVWFRVRFDLPAQWAGKDIELDLGRIRDMDYTYVNGALVGSGEGISRKRAYRVQASLLRATGNVIAIQILNFDDKGGLTGYKGKPDLTIRPIEDSVSGPGPGPGPRAGGTEAITLPHQWKFAIQNADPPLLPKYEAEYQPFGDLRFHMEGQGAIAGYRRQLDIANAIAAVSYETNGVHYTREYFASESPQALVVHLSADRPGKITFSAGLGTPHRDFSIRRVDDRTLGLYVRVRDGVLRGVSFWHVLAAHGKVDVTADSIFVRGADDVVLYGLAATSFINYHDVGGDPAAKCRAALVGLSGLRYPAVRACHVAGYRKYFGRFQIRFGKERSLLPTDLRIERFTPGTDPNLIALYVQYSRYLLLASSAPTAPYPANLQGIWNDELSPPWGSKFTTNINLEMNYWPAEELNLPECEKPLFRLIRNLSAAGKATAADYYRCPGWVLHHNTDLWCGTAPINASTHGIWPTGGAWLCHQIWEHYLFTGDKDFLRRYYPEMRAAADFFAHFLVADPATGWLISTPSASPEHGGLVAGPTMDHQLIRDLFRNCIAAAAALDVDRTFSGELEKKCARIAPDQIGRFGQLQEWLEDKDDSSDTHRHISHLWGVYPGTDITWKSPMLMKAARQSLIYRGDGGTGWSLAWKVNCWARFRDGDHAMALVDKLLSSAAHVEGGEHGGVYPDMLDAHPPFQIDGNFGGAAGVAEMLLQSQDSGIDVLPALPAALPEGEIRGICARGGFVLDISWAHGTLRQVRVLSRLGGDCVLRYEGRRAEVATVKGMSYLFDGDLMQASDSRRDLLLDSGWRTAESADSSAYRGSEAVSYDDRHWMEVDVPHNWDDYGGYRRLRHGNLHGYAWYRRPLVIRHPAADRRYFLWFEGVGSYATVWVNGSYAGYHAGGRTSFTVDITHALRPGGGENIITVRADHPAFIRDLPWICGGCSDERGFSEGSQPMGIFRPVHLVVTHAVRIEPFGVHVWNDTSASPASATLFLETACKDYGDSGWDGELVQRLEDRGGRTVAMAKTVLRAEPGQATSVRQTLNLRRPRLWSPDDPYLYRVVTEMVVAGRVIDRVTTPYGIRVIRWPDLSAPGPHPFLVNGKRVFINGIAGYEHRLGGSHAFTDAGIRARVSEIRAAGFNAFRDAHQPHNLRFQQCWDSLGMLWWPQLSAHIWFDSPAFRRNFLRCLTEWVTERRNSPSLILWGLQNESKLPADFARECAAVIRRLDPTASAQRRIVTCNGGEGTDWDVPQNWTGTYGGDPRTYAADLRRQVLVGEYGAWRTADLHGDVPFSEERMDRLMELKIRLADSVRDEVAGHFMWLFSSHDNPGRVQSGEGFRELDRVGPVNYKGLLTSWGEPVDMFYCYRAHFVPAAVAPMVYIAGHSWPDRWLSGGKKSGIVVYSNCDSVALYNGGADLGMRKGPAHFQWDDVDVRWSRLVAVGFVHGKVAARDSLELHHLPRAPERLGTAVAGAKVATGPSDTADLVAPAPGYRYVYRVNCGGPDYVDHLGHRWLADRHWTMPGTWGSFSWTDGYPGMSPFFASQRRVSDDIAGTRDGRLFADFRYGLGKLGYTFPVQDGWYRVELYFTEPWLGLGGGMNCAGWRRFDVAVNGETVIRDLDIWKAAGTDRALKRVVVVRVRGGKLVVTFPREAAGQALISAIAVATTDNTARAAAASPGWMACHEGIASMGTWLDTGDTLRAGGKLRTIAALPPALYGADWVSGNCDSFRLTVGADVYVAADSAQPPAGYEDTHTRVLTDAAGGETLEVYRRRVAAGATVAAQGELAAVQEASSMEPAFDAKPVVTYKVPGASGGGPVVTGLNGRAGNDAGVGGWSGVRVNGDTTEWRIVIGVGDEYSLSVKYRRPGNLAGRGRLEIRMEDGTLVRESPVALLPSPAGKWNYFDSTTGTMINAGRYIVRLIAPGTTVGQLQVQ
ncbi:MAG TPA: glycoside hydrolase N-terminal domain-containing protein [Puia sp.]|nr:glycoside hydrolase N-terminal domain-containing protein [Puia sp.]